jgi:WD40 repeat protein
MEPVAAHAGGGSTVCAYSPSGEWIATAAKDFLKLWDAVSGQLVGLFPLRAPATALAVGAGGRIIACGDTSGQLYIVRVVTD